MATMFLAGYISGLVVGTVYGFIIFKVVSVIKTVGSLKIDKSDTEPKLYLELKKEIEDISDKKRIVLEIDNVNFSSHKTQGL